MPPGTKLRFTVGRSGERVSGTWVVWTTKRTDDVYLAARHLGRVHKVSLHASGRWQHGFISDDVAAQQGQTAERSRHWDRWERRPVTPESAASCAVSIRVADEDLGPDPGNPNNTKPPHVWIPPPGPGQLTAVDLAIVRDPKVRIRYHEEIWEVAQLGLPSGEVVRITARRTPMPAEVSQRNDQFRIMAMADPAVRLALAERAMRPSQLRFVLAHNITDRGTLVLTECCGSFPRSQVKVLPDTAHAVGLQPRPGPITEADILELNFNSPPASPPGLPGRSV